MSLPRPRRTIPRPPAVLSNGATVRTEMGRNFRPSLNQMWFQVAWVKWMDSSAPFTMMPDTNYCNIIVPTMDTMQMSYLLGMLITNNKPVSYPIMPCPSPPKAWLVFHTNQLVVPSALVLYVPHLPDRYSPRCCALGRQAQGRHSPSPTSFSRTCHWNISVTSSPSQLARQPTRPRTSLIASWTRGRTPLAPSPASLNQLPHLSHQILILVLHEMTQQKPEIPLGVLRCLSDLSLPLSGSS